MRYLNFSLTLILFYHFSVFSQPIQINEIASGTNSTKTPFMGIDGITVYASSLYLVDRVMQRVAVLGTKDLRLQTEYSRSDNPDATLLLPGFIAVTSKFIFITDFGKNMIRIYKKNFDYVKKIVVYGGIFGIAADVNENIWIASVTMDKKQSIKRIDFSGNILAELPLVNAKGNPMEMYYTFCIDKDNYFYVAYYTKNCIEVLHPSRGFIRQFMVPGLPSNVPWSKSDRGLFKKADLLPEGEMFESITVDRNGHLYILTGDYSETPNREVDICSPDGKFLGWCVLNEKSHLIRSDESGHLISVEGNKNKVKVYELKQHITR
jgi:hypothetical protein